MRQATSGGEKAVVTLSLVGSQATVYTLESIDGLTSETKPVLLTLT